MADSSVAQSALRQESVDQLDSVIGAVTEQFIIATDADGRIEVFNPGPENLLHVSAAQVQGHDVVSTLSTVVAIDPVDRGPTQSADGEAKDQLAAQNPRDRFGRLVTAAGGGNANIGEWEFARDGTTGSVQVSVTPRHDAAGTVIGFLFVGTDVSYVREESRQEDEFVNLISREQVQLVVSAGTRELVVTGDAVRLGQACDNLLSNAIKFTPAGGRVTVAHWTPTATPTVQRPVGRCCR